MDGIKRFSVLIAGVVMIYLNPHLGDDIQLKAAMALSITWFISAAIKIIANAYKEKTIVR